MSTAIERTTASRKVRLMQLSDLLQQGNPSHHELAQHFGITVQQVRSDISMLYRHWGASTPKRARKQRTLRTRQLEHIHQLSLESYHRSRDGGIEQLAVQIPKQCPRCFGEGVIEEEDKRCPRCVGSGEIIKTEVREVKKELPGDSAHLSNATKVLTEICKLNGIAVPTKKQIDQKVSGGTVNAHLHAGSLEDNPFRNADPAAIHEAMAALHHAEQTALPSAVPIEQDRGIVDGYVIVDDPEPEVVNAPEAEKPKKKRVRHRGRS